MNRFNFSQQAIDNIPLPESGRVSAYDSRVPQLCAWIASTGRITFYYYAWDANTGKPKRVKLGVFRKQAGGSVEMSINAARTKAKDIAGEYAKGNDPAAERAARRAADQHGETVGQLWPKFLQAPSLRTKRPRSAKTISDYKSRYNLYLAKWAKRRIADITTEDLAALHRLVTGKAGEVTANRVVSYFGALCQYAVHHGVMASNPADAVQRNHEETRTRYLTDDEAKKFMKAVKAEYAKARQSKQYGGNPDTHRLAVLDVIMFSLYTGQRRGNVQSLKWSAVDLRRKTMTIRADEFKTKREHVANLPPQAVDILKNRKGNGSDYVFNSNRSKTGHVVEPKTAMRDIIKAAGIEHMTFHDLRHTAATWMVNSGADLYVVSKQLGHQSMSTTERYSHLDITKHAEATAKGAAAFDAAAESEDDAE